MMSTCTGQGKEPVVRPATQANRFYTGDARLLSQEVDSLLDLHRGENVYHNLAALIVPHAGYYFSGNVAAAAYMTIPADKRYKRIFLLGPSHHEWLDGASVNTAVDRYATPLGEVDVDHETAVRLTEAAATVSGGFAAGTTAGAPAVLRYEPRAHDREHCLEVQLPFLQRFYALHASPSNRRVPPIVPIIISTNDFRHLQQIAQVLKPYFTEENLFIISSDFSHYPSYDDACQVDARTGKAVESGDVARLLAVLQENAHSHVRNLATSACGEQAIMTLMLMMDKGCQVKHLLYQNSGDVDNHDRNRVVGYHAFAITRGDATAFSLTDDEKRLLKDIALKSIKASLGITVSGASSAATVSGGSAAGNQAVLSQHPSLQAKCGAFVSLHKHGRLRGCIGHFGEDTPLHKIVAQMARAAAFEDPRFMPVSAEELPDIDIEISVLTPMRRIQSLDEVELHRHGIYIRKGYRSGTFLPRVADEVNWTKEEFVSHCAQDKAGIGWDGWKDAELYVYEAIVF